MPNIDFQRRVTPDFPKVPDLERNEHRHDPEIDDAFRDTDTVSVTRAAGFITQVVYTDGALTMTVDISRTENNSIVSVQSTLS